jgi:hypothetical protein
MCELDHFKQVLMALAQRAEQPRSQVTYQHDNPWAEYERRKRELQGKGFSSEQHEAEIRKVCEEFEL